MDWNDVVATRERLALIADRSPSALQDYLIACFYTHIPPGRSKEFRTLLLKAGPSSTENVLYQTKTGQWIMDLISFKNGRFVGRDETILPPSLVSPLERFLSVRTKQHDNLFLNSFGEPFSASAWNGKINSLFQKHIGSTALRKSFVSDFYSRPEASDLGLRESVAASMRHSVREAQRTYDKRGSAAKKVKALQHIANRAPLLPLPPHRRPE